MALTLMMMISENITIETLIITTLMMTKTTNSTMPRDKASNTCRGTLITNNVSITEIAGILGRPKAIPITIPKITLYKNNSMMIINNMIQPRKNKSLM